MAVFPDRIVLKNSTDSAATIQTAIEAGGTDEIAQGEIVLGLETGTARIYTRDSLGAIVTISGGEGGGGGRGDGGDFDAGEVSTSFVLGVYGGGDFSAADYTIADDIPVELLNADEGPDGGSF